MKLIQLVRRAPRWRRERPHSIGLTLQACCVLTLRTLV